MHSFNKKFLTLFISMQLLAVQAFAITTTHVAYCDAMTGKGLAENIQLELEVIQKRAEEEHKFFEFISMTTEDCFIYVLYNLSDRNEEVNPFITKVAYASAWSYSGLHEEFQEKITSLQTSALDENKTIHFLDIQNTLNGNGYIIYEISR